MSDNIEAISVRTTRLNNLILGRSEATSKIPKQVANGLCRESLLVMLFERKFWMSFVVQYLIIRFRIRCVCCMMSVIEII